MMFVSRLAGALLLRDGDAFVLVGNTKEPCDWAGVGFAAPAELEAGAVGVRALVRAGELSLKDETCVSVRSEGRSMEAVAEVLSNRFLIRRNASVSERLWRIVTGVSEESDTIADTDATWLLEMPERVWDVVRDAALRCL